MSIVSIIQKLVEIIDSIRWIHLYNIYHVCRNIFTHSGYYESSCHRTLQFCMSLYLILLTLFFPFEYFNPQITFPINELLVCTQVVAMPSCLERGTDLLTLSRVCETEMKNMIPLNLYLQLWLWDLRGVGTLLVKQMDRWNCVSTLQCQDDRILVLFPSTSLWRHKMALQVSQTIEGQNTTDYMACK